MNKWRRFPIIYEINTWVWLNALSRKLGRTVSLADVPQDDLKRLAGYGFDAFWLMGVWRRSVEGRKIAQTHDGLLGDYREALPDFTLDDVIGSPYAISRYQVDPALGGDDALRELRVRLRQLDLRIILDFVPNHLACDHRWITEHPARLVQGTEDDLSTGNYFRTVDGRIFAHGKDPHFPAWTDTVQLDYRNSETRAAMSDVLLTIAEQCDGIRCDMAMLETHDGFLRAWGGQFDRPGAEFWSDSICQLKSHQPDCLLIAEAYWEECHLQEMGFDFVYDKPLYNKLEGEDATSVRGHLGASFEFQKRLVRFVENHDERRAAKVFWPEQRTRAVATLGLTLPGMRLLHQGQIKGRRAKLPVQLCRWQPERSDSSMERFHQRLLKLLNDDVFHDGEWRLIEPRAAWPGNESYRNFVAHIWTLGEKFFLVVVSLSSSTAQCYLRLDQLDLGGRVWYLNDVLNDIEYERDGDDLVEKGLYLDVPPHVYHFFEFRREPINRDLRPPGLKELAVVRSTAEPIYGIALSPDGGMIAAGVGRNVWLWNLADAEPIGWLEGGHNGIVGCVAWSPKGRFLASGSDDHRVCLWDMQSLQLAARNETAARPPIPLKIDSQFLDGHTDHVVTLAWSADGDTLASGSIDRSIMLYNVRSLRGVRRLAHSPLTDQNDAINCLAWSPTGKHLASGSGDQSVDLWDLTLLPARPVHKLRARDWVSSVTWSRDGKFVASGAGGGTVDIWDASTGQHITVCEGHTRRVLSVAFSEDSKSRLLVSKAADGTVRLWKSGAWETYATLQEEGEYMSGLAFKKDTSTLATRDDKSHTIRIWDVDLDVLLGETNVPLTPSIYYKNAKVVLVGDSGVGKTGLWLVLTGQEYEACESTHGRHVKPFRGLGSVGIDEAERAVGGREIREIMVWDLAGQQGYRVFHQLCLQQATIGLVVFDGSKLTHPFGGVSYWAHALDEASRDRPVVKILVAARCDMGRPLVDRECIEQTKLRYGFAAYVEVSAKLGEGIEDLSKLIYSAVAWDGLIAHSSPELFYDIKVFLRKETERGRVLATPDSLLKSFQLEKPGAALTSEIFDHCLRLLERANLITRLTVGNMVLLQPEMLDAYCSALALAAGKDPGGLGCVLKDCAIAGEFLPPAKWRLEIATERVMLLATLEEVVKRGIALTQPTGSGEMLVFPSEARIDRPEFVVKYPRAYVFRFQGAAQATYATLVVSLVYAPEFSLHGQPYRNAAVFHAVRRQVCGFTVRYPEEDLAELEVFFEAGVESDIKRLFLGLVKRHLEKNALRGSVEGSPVYHCAYPGCTWVHSKEAIALAREAGEDSVSCPLRHSTLIEDLTEPSADADERVVSIEAEAREEQKRQARLMVLKERERIRDFHVFVCHNSKDKPVVRSLANKLRDYGILPWIDENGILAGGQFVPELEKVISAVPTVAVIFGPSSLGDWQKQEYYAFFRRFVDYREGEARTRPGIIPVLLPGAPAKPPELEGFLGLFSYVDFRRGGLDDRAQFRRLVEAITTQIGAHDPRSCKWPLALANMTC
jgi:small GTP-binding protein